MEISDFFSTFKISSAALNAYKTQLAVTAENIANASTTRTDQGKPYKRKVLVKKAINNGALFSGHLMQARTRLRTSNPNHIASRFYQTKGDSSSGLVDLETEIIEKEQFRSIYDPNHPDANLEGYVEFPDINVVWEMLELITASRAYEANVTVMHATKSLARRALEI